MTTFVQRSRIEATAETLFQWHARPGAFERLSPPWESVRLVSQTGGIQSGGRVVITVPMGPFRKRWVAEHLDYIDGRQFRDVQLSGPFARWEHTHSIVPDGAQACILEDHIEYAVPLGALGQLCGGPFVRAKLQRVFHYRHRVTCDDIAAHKRFSKGTSMRILITGASGLVGSALIPFLTTGGHQVIRLIRKSAGDTAGSVKWDPAAGQLNAADIEGFDAVIHLAGENIASGRWTAARKARIRDSRVQGTRLLSETLAKLQRPPKVLVSASAIGFCGDRGDDVLDEQSPAGTGFLPEVCQEWEAAAEPARRAGIRVVHPRLGVVLSPAGGALAKMLTPFKMGAGGVLGSGRQFMSWVALDDVIGGIHQILNDTNLTGPVNLVAPNPVTNAEFTKTLGRVLSRPTIIPMPAFAARLAFGEMADALLLSSTRVVPRKLTGDAYPFRFPELEGALRHLLGK